MVNCQTFIDKTNNFNISDEFMEEMGDILIPMLSEALGISDSTTNTTLQIQKLVLDLIKGKLDGTSIMEFMFNSMPLLAEEIPSLEPYVQFLTNMTMDNPSKLYHF